MLALRLLQSAVVVAGLQRLATRPVRAAGGRARRPWRSRLPRAHRSARHLRPRVVTVDCCTTRTTRVRGRILRIAERPGDPGRVPLVLCNGIGAALDLFDPFVAQLEAGRPIVLLDAPGVGNSPPPVVPYLFASLAMTLRTALERRGHHRVDLLGISWEGGLAQQLAFLYPAWCRRLVLAATGTGWTMVPARPTVLARMSSPRRDPEYATRIAGEIYGGSARLSASRASRRAARSRLRREVTCTNFSPWLDGRACRFCH